MSAFLGQNARVKSVQMKEGKQLVEAGSASRVRLLTRKLSLQATNCNGLIIIQCCNFAC